MRAGLRLLEEREAEMLELRSRLQTGLAQAEAGEFTEGTGADAIRRAFAQAREALWPGTSG